MFSRQRTNGTLQRHLPAKYMKQVDVSMNMNTVHSLLPNCRNCFSTFSNFSVIGDQKWKKRQKRHFVGFARNILSAHQLTLERPERVARIWRFSSRHQNEPRRSIFFRPQNYHNQRIGSALRPRHLFLSAPLHVNTTQMVARPAGIVYPPSQMHQAPISPPPRRPSRGLGCAAFESDHAECG